MKVTSTFTVEQTGVGKPDYTREVSAGKQRSGLTLAYQQQLVVLAVCFTDTVPPVSPFPWVRAPLAAGAQSHFYDLATGILTPYTYHAGYQIVMVQKDWTCNQDIEMWIYYDGALLLCPGMSSGGDNVYINPVFTYNSLTLDPTAASDHTFDIVVVNVGGSDLEGGFTYSFTMEPVGTPAWPMTKKCMCPYCQHLQEEKVGTTRIECEKCGKTYFVHDFSRIREI